MLVLTVQCQWFLTYVSVDGRGIDFDTPYSCDMKENRKFSYRYLMSVCYFIFFKLNPT